MEKQDAIDFIVEAFEQGKSPSEIARELSREMKAPFDIVAGFVNRTLDQRIALLGSTPSLPEPEPPVAPETPAGPAVDWYAPTPGFTPPNLGWDWTPTEAEAPAESDDAFEVPSFAPDGDSAGEFSWEIPAPADSDAELPLPAAAPTPSPAAPVSPAPAAAPAAPAITPREIDPKLEKFILDALGSDKKHSDIVMAVCERTGMDWGEAQRVVGRVGAMNRKKVASRRNRVLIPLAIVAMLAGLALIAAGLQELTAYSGIVQGLIDEGAQGAVNAGMPQDAYRPDYLIATIVSGLGLLVGGGVGLFQALKAQVE